MSDYIPIILCANVCASVFLKDKTFGLKNKKGKKQQTFVKQVTQQVGHVIVLAVRCLTP